VTHRSSLALTVTVIALAACSTAARPPRFTARRSPLFSLASTEDRATVPAPLATLTDASTTARAEPNPAPDTAPEPVVAQRALTLEERLEAHEVDDDRPWRGTLYSWLTPQRAAELAQHRQVLTATPTSGPYLSPFSKWIARAARRNDRVGAIARALQSSPDLSRYRYAWSAPYATAMGFRGQPYGTALVRVELRPDALILRLDTRDARLFRLFDREQREVPIERWEHVRPRIAAVYHARRGSDVRVPFREYVLCNAAAFARWSLGTPEIRDELTREQQLVDDLVADWGTLAPHATPMHAEHEWRASSRAAPRTAWTRWAATMATAAPHYAFSARNLRALAQQLALYDDSAQHDERLSP
jgi:hypothetical protein